MSRAWKLGKVFVLRHAGFPFDWIEELGLSAATVARLDQVLEQEQVLLRLGAPPESVQQGKPRPPPRRPEGWAAALEAWKTAHAAAEEAWKEERARLRQRLHQRAGDEAIQGAVFLSNPSVYENTWRRYATEPLRADNADARRLDRQAYTYLQRLCGKNETTSFFGPMGYGQILPDDRVTVAVRPSGSTRRRTFLAFWAVTELSKAIQRDRVLRSDVPLRLNPMFAVTATEARCDALSLKAPLAGRTAQLVDLLRAGPQTYRTAAARLGLAPGDLERETVPLLQVAFLLRGLPFATHDFSTLESLRQAVSALPPSPERDGWTQKLDSLAALLTSFQEGTLEVRRKVLGELEALFTQLTGKPARRGEGGVYEDRLVIYEEASSPFALEFGKSFAQKLEEALTPGLEASAAYGEGIQRGHREAVAAQLGSEGELDFLSYTVKTRPAVVEGTRFSPVPPIPVADPGSKLALTPDAIAQGSDGARFALPDVCLSAPPGQGEAGGVRIDGPVEVLLARVHHHLLLYSWLSAFHPEPDAYRAVSQRFVQREPALAGLTSLAVRRRNKGFYVFPGRSLLQSVTDATDMLSQALAPSEVRVRLTPQGPQLAAPDGTPLQLYFPLDDLSKFPPFAALSHPQVVHAPLKSSTGHTPRIELGAATYQRERWQVATAELANTTGVALQLAVLRVRRRLGLPRFVYGRTPKERKPYLFDLESPFAMELLRHVISEVESITFEEMLPAPDGLFLRDARGRYTFELRMQAERWTVTPPE